jgi:hypothetical protein
MRCSNRTLQNINSITTQSAAQQKRIKNQWRRATPNNLAAPLVSHVANPRILARATTWKPTASHPP